MTGEIQVRPARPGEVVQLAPLLYEVSPAAHDRFAGGRERALRLIAKGLERSGTSGSTEVTQVAEMAAGPAGTATADRARRAGLGLLSLETEVDNGAARSLYEGFGFDAREVGRPSRGLPQYVSYVKALA